LEFLFWLDESAWGALVISRIAVFALASVLAAFGAFMVSSSDKMFQAMERLHVRFRFMVTLNPMSRLNSSGFSKISSIFVGIIAIMMAMLLFIVVLFGKAD